MTTNVKPRSTSARLFPLLVASSIPYGCLLTWLAGDLFGSLGILGGLLGMVGLCLMSALAGYLLGGMARWLCPALRQVEGLWIKAAFAFIGVYYVFFALRFLGFR